MSINLSNAERDADRERLNKQLDQLREQLAERRTELGEGLVAWATGLADRSKSSAVSHVLKLRDFQSQGTTDASRILPDGAVLW